MKKLMIALSCMLLTYSISAQTEEELKQEIAPKKAEIAKLQGEVDALKAKIDALPGWKVGAFGTVGGSLSQFNNWYSQGTPDVSSGNIGITLNAFANKKEAKYFWRNALNVNLGWVKFDDESTDEDDDSFREATDVFNITSLYGYKLSEKIAISTLGEYRTTILNNFNDPGYLDLGVGATWTPIENLVVVVHPLNYNFVFSKGDAVFESSLGAKIVADYTRQIGAINFKSNLSMFQSYKSSDLSNFTWINSFGYTLWKGIGVGFEFGLRGNRQEAVNFANDRLLAENSDATTFELGDDAVDNELQTYWLLGLNYKF
ncbi:DUF3078 domain-containing protein [Dokdonia sinensis]|uniref:DUF3078 domain-containing protein n=1 Tax=Dokdonia sinensis TaxID=2479847 RepID=A0A3M0GP96_9FLAO|nr:DUF3078 domain-containing protein [Dokdonia sinensis]RMB63503.1 DUF3078 domain-containing protein [Dokdonia sinensis]